MTCGIYVITNKINHMQYVGQSINIEERFYRHSLASDDCYFHNAIRKYGWKNFETKILEECELDRTILNTLEQKYIKELNTLMPNGYNMTIGGDTSSYRERKAVKQYDLNGVFIQEFPSIKEAARQLNIDYRYIGAAANRKGRVTAGNFQWCFVGQENFISDNPKTYGGPEKVSVCQYSLDGNYIQDFESLYAAMKATNLADTKQIKKCCEKKDNFSAGGYQWRYKKDYQEKISPYNSKIAHNTTGKKIIQLDKNGNQIAVYDSAKQAAEAVGMKKGGNAAILRVCNGEQKTSMGYIWRYN